jgi:hypothetical protein
LAGKPEEKTALRNPTYKWKDHITMDEGTGLEYVAGSCEYGNEPLGSTKGKIS